MTKMLSAWSLSRLQTYEDCPAKFKYMYIDKVPVPEPTDPSHPLVRGKRVHKLAEDFVQTDPQDDVMVPEELSKFREQFYELRDLRPMVEVQWAYTNTLKPTGWFAKGRDAAWLRMVPDALVIYDDGTADVIDHKTGKFYADKTKDQAELLAWGAMRRYADVRSVSVLFWYLDTGDEQVYDYDRSDYKTLLDPFKPRVAAMFGEQTWATRPSRKCNWCPFSKGEGGPCSYG